MSYEDDAPEEDDPQRGKALQRRQDVANTVLGMTSEPDVVDFLQAVGMGEAKYLAGASVGWPPAEVDRRMKDPAFRSLADGAKELALDGIEQKMMDMAMKGNAGLIQFILTNRRPSEWADRRVHEHAHVHGVSEADKAGLRAGIVATLQGDRSRIRDFQGQVIESRAREIERGEAADGSAE